ncbi:hypothetical protein CAUPRSCDRAFT_12327 [Caulochytrium protostelioides]|nr:hypothetical protein CAUPRSCDRAFT_12327 [Caulochytrium protostelioides]
MPILPRTASLHGACDLPMRTQPTPRTNEEETTTASLHLSEATTAASTTTLTELDASSPALTHGGMTPESHASSLMASPRVGVIAHGSPQADMALPPPAVDAHAHTHAMAASYSFAESPIMPPETRPSSPVRGDGLVSSAGAVTLASRAKDPRKPFQVAYAYQPTRADELRLTPGQRVFMTRVFPDGWAYVECPHEQTLGMIPLHHLQAEIVLGTRLTHVGGRHLRKVSVVHPSAAHAVAARARASSFMSSASSPVLPIAMPSPSAMRSPMSGDGVVVGSMGGGDGRSLGLAYTSHIDPSLQTKHQTTDWRFLCRCEPRYQLWIDCLKDSQMAAGFVGVPPVAAIPVFNRARSRREMGTPDACARCSGQRADHASVL